MKTISSQSLACAQAIGNRETFKTYGALRAENVTGLSVWDSGRLSGDDLDKFREDPRSIRYVVYSYNTPIAWVMADGEVYRVAQKFSVTTSKHQGKTAFL